MDCRRSLGAAALALVPLSTIATAQTLHVSRITTRPDGRQIGPNTAFPNQCAAVYSISDDGRFAVFVEYSNTAETVSLLDRVDGSMVALAPFPGIARGFVSGDGNYLFFESGYAGIPAGGLHRVIRATGQIADVSKGAGGATPNGASYYRNATSDGRYVGFQSFASNIALEPNAVPDIFQADMQLGTTVLVSVGSNGPSDDAFISSDGRFVAFSNSGDDLSPGDHNGGVADAYVRDLLLATTELMSVTPANAAGNGASYAQWVSDDGRYVAFKSYADNLVVGDVNNRSDLFLRDRQLGTTALVPLSSTGGQLSDHFFGVLSDDGRYFAFDTAAANAVPGDTNGMTDLFLRDLLLGTTERLDLTPTGGEVTVVPVGNAYASAMAITPGGRFVAFHSPYSQLVDGDTNAGSDGFLADRASSALPVTSYCVAKTGSNGCTPVITCSGEPHASGLDSFYVAATRVRANLRGAFIWSGAAAATPFGGGTLCVASPYHLQAVPSGTYSGATGCGAGQFVFRASPGFFAAHGLPAGTALFGQFLFRDNGFAPPNNIGLTDAIQFTIAP